MSMELRRERIVRRALSVALLALLVGAEASSGAPRPKAVWATVNVCDTQRYPNTMGVRGSMPGNGTRELMFMRFRAQRYDSSRKSWFPVKGKDGRPAVSRWIFTGSARAKARQAGWNFTFGNLTPGTTYVFRGVADFEWRARRWIKGRLRTVVVRTAHAKTKAGFRSTVGADPPGYSSGTCEIF